MRCRVTGFMFGGTRRGQRLRQYGLTTWGGSPIILARGVALFSGEFAAIGFILFLAFLLFGPRKLPDIARTLGKGLGELRRASNELRSSFEEEIRNLDHPTEGASAPAPPYGHDYSEPAPEEPETRT
jgi:TatA/E family protein of Tat protein translocase